MNVPESASHDPDEKPTSARSPSGSLIDFIRDGWGVLEPGSGFMPNWHLSAVADHLEAVSRGQIRNLLINIPPRHGKSLAVSVFWPMWEWTQQPHLRWLYTAYALPLAVRDSVKCRRLILSNWYQQNWGDAFQLARDQNTKDRFDNDRGGNRIATSVGGSATGEGGDRVVVDDPHNVAQSESRLSREQTLLWWDQTMSTRLNDPRHGARVIVMQRLHEKDLSGHVLKQGGYEHLCLPAEFESTRRCVTQTGWSDPRQVDGELLWPTRLGADEIAEAKLRLGPSGYAGQFQQRPAPDGGARFRAEWFRYYRLSGAKEYHLIGSDDSMRICKIDDCTRFAVMDPAGTERSQNQRACYTVIQVWDVTQSHDMILVHQYRKQVQTPDAADAAMKIVHEFKPNYLAVEKDGIGLGICQTLRRTGLAIKPIKARGSKEARSETAEIRMAAGMIFFPTDAPYRWDLEQELLHFPVGEDADQVDALAHAAILVQSKAAAPSPLGRAAAADGPALPGASDRAIEDPTTTPSWMDDASDDWVTV